MKTFDGGPPRIGSLFSGTGALDLAVEKVFGGRVIWHCDPDPAASKVLAHHWPGVPNLGDVSEVNWKALRFHIEDVVGVSLKPDILCGGFPCQDLSSSGKRRGMGEGTRSGLWASYATAIESLRPRYAVIENVRGLLSVKSKCRVGPSGESVELRAGGRVLGDLADLGYDARWQVVSASAIGAPHRRDRVFILASPHTPDELHRDDARRVEGSSPSG